MVFTLILALVKALRVGFYVEKKLDVRSLNSFSTPVVLWFSNL